MPTNYFKCNNCEIYSDKIFHKVNEIITCKKCYKQMVKIYKNINTSMLTIEEKNESISSCIENNKKELKKLKGD